MRHTLIFLSLGLALSAEARTQPDSISVIDTGSRKVTTTISLTRAGERLKGSNPN